MAEPTVDRDPVEFLAAEFIDRLRDGDRPTVEEYAFAHPELADQIRDLFPTIAAMENLKLDKEVSSDGRASLGPARIERLGDLRIVREIGRGGMGIVYEAEQESLGRRVAVKVLPKQSLLDDKHLRRFRREAKTAARLHHTNIVPILGVGEQDGFHYYVMQIIRGAGLDEVIPRLKQLVTVGHIGAMSSPYDKRAANISSVAMGLVRGDLRLPVKVDDTWGSECESNSHPSAGTGSNRAAITTIAPDKGDSILVDDSFVLAEELKVAGPANADTNSVVGATRFGTAYWQSVARIGVQVARALNYAHRQGTLHRDIKPANLLIDEGGTVWVADFGLAKAMEHDKVSRTGDIVGTLRYMAPEQFQGATDARSDIYSLGVTLYELLTLKPAFDEAQRKRSFIHESGALEPNHPRRENPSIPRDLETIILKAIALEPDSRYQSASDLADDLQRFLDDRPILARRASAAERVRRWARRNPAIATLSGLAASLLLLVAVVSTTAYFRTEAARNSEQQQRVKAEATSELAWNALDKIFERLAPHRYVSPEDFAVETEESADFNVNTQPVLSDEAAALLDEMLVFYRKLAEQGDDTDEFRQRIAEANRRVGDIRRRLGQFGPAEQAYRQAIAVYSQLADGGKTNPKQVAALASIYNELGEVHRSARQSDLAREAFDNARSILEPICAQECPPEVRYELARSLFLSVHRSDGLARRGPGPGFGTPNGKRTGSRRDGKSAPGKSPQGETRPGEGFGRVGEFARDAEKIRRAVELLEDLNAEFQVPDYQQLLALCYSERHSHLRFQNPDQSAEAIAKSISLLEDLVARYPQNPDYRFTLSTVYVKRLREFWTRPTAEELADIKTRATTALALLQELHRDHPGVPEYALSELEVHRSLASRLHAAGRHQEAELHFLAAIQLYDSLGEFELSDSFNIMRAAFTRNLYADSLLEQFRKAKEAGEEPRVEWLLKARENLQTWVDRLASYADADPRHYMAVGFSYKRLATICSELGDEAAAAEATASMHKYLPQDRWGDSERNGQRGSPTVDREAANRSATPSRSEQFSEDNK